MYGGEGHKYFNGGGRSVADRLQVASDQAASHISDTSQNFLNTQRRLAAASPGQAPPPPPPSGQGNQQYTQNKKAQKSKQFFNKVKNLKQADPKGWNKGGNGNGKW